MPVAWYILEQISHGESPPFKASWAALDTASDVKAVDVDEDTYYEYESNSEKQFTGQTTAQILTQRNQSWP